MIIGIGRTPDELRFRVGPSAGSHGAFTRANAGADARVGAVFGACASLTDVTVGSGTLAATIDDAAHWPDVLLALFDSIVAECAPPRSAR